MNQWREMISLLCKPGPFSLAHSRRNLGQCRHGKDKVKAPLGTGEDISFLRIVDNLGGVCGYKGSEGGSLCYSGRLCSRYTCFGMFDDGGNLIRSAMRPSTPRGDRVGGADLLDIGLLGFDGSSKDQGQEEEPGGRSSHALVRLKGKA